MSDHIDPYTDIGGVQEVAVMLKVGVACVRRWIERRTITACPKPVKILVCGNIYSLAEWRAWHKLWATTRARRPRKIHVYKPPTSNWRYPPKP